MPTIFGYNLELAWKRLKLDRKDRCFVSHPFLIQLIEQDLNGWLTRIAENLSVGYNPMSAVVCYEPKPGWLLRPGCTLRIEDELVYTATLGFLLPKIEIILRWAQGKTDTSYILQKDHNAVKWVKSGFLAWDDFRQKSLTIARKSEFVVTIDVSAFYENIDIDRLISDLRNVGVEPREVKLLSACLNRWAEPRRKGIPQGYTASDILAKLYFNSVDQAIANEGYTHLRYVDDIRIFCSDLHEAKSSLHLIIDRLRLRGLNVQSAKTEIMRADKAIVKIDGVTPVIRSIAGELATELRELGVTTDYNISLQELERIISESPVAPSAEVLVQAFKSHFLESAGEEFDCTLFHYILTRLGLLKSREAVLFCLSLLPRRPEETKFILKYFADIHLNMDEIESIVNFVGSTEATNAFQIYQILKFFYETDVTHEKALSLVRKFIRDRNFPSWLRSYAYVLIGRIGTTADLEHIESLYSNAEHSIEHVDIICALHRYERVRRNAFLARTMNDGFFEAQSVRWVRQKSGS